MKHRVFRLFVDYEKEEQWLNEMSAKGLQFSSHWFGQFVFEDGKPGEYTYRLELMQSHPRRAEGQAYIRFMEEAGVECVDTFWHWAYFRKKTSDGPFDLYTDSHSKIKHYKRIAAVAGFGAALNAAICIYDIGVLHITPFLLIVNAVVAVLLGRMTWCYYKRMRKLRDAANVRE